MRQRYLVCCLAAYAAGPSAGIGRIFRTHHPQSVNQPLAGRPREKTLSELDDCVPDTTDVEQTIEQMELARLLDAWLDSLPEQDCIWFVRRYWYGDTVKSLAKEYGCTQNQMAQQMLRLRKKLKAFLEQEGVVL